MITCATILRLQEEALRPHGDKLMSIPSSGPGEPYYFFLYLLAKELRAKVIMELGTYIGTSAKYMAEACPEAEVWTMDINPDARNQLNREPIYPNIRFLEASSRWIPAEFTDRQGSIDLLFIDANHDYSLTIGSYKEWWPFVRPGGVIVLDDATLDSEMMRAIKEINEVDEVIDLPKLHYTGFAAVIKPNESA